MRKFRTASLAFVVLLGLAGMTACTGEKGGDAEDAALAYVNASREEACSMKSGQSDSDIEECKAAAQAAGDTEAKTEADYQVPPEVVRSGDWQDGQFVEVAFQLPDGPALNYVYGLLEENGEWKVSRFNQIDAELVGREDGPCRTLAESELELSECG